MVGPVIQMILDHKVKAPQLLAIIQKLRMAGVWASENHRQTDTLRVILDYVQSQKAIPPNIEALEEFIRLVPSLDSDFHSGTRKRYADNHDAYRNAICAVAEEPKLAGTVDWDLTVNAACETARRKLYSYNYSMASRMAAGEQFDNPDDKNKPLCGVNDARKWLQKQLMRDVFADSGSIQGDFHDNLDWVQQKLLNDLENPSAQRVLTGFPSIDDAIVMGPTQKIRYVGIAGFTNHGKSSVLMTMIYNWLRQGKRVLLVPLELDAEESWKAIAWLHLESHPKLNLPSLSHWAAHPEQVTAQHKANLKFLIDDLKKGNTLPGKLEVALVDTWPEIVQAANAPEVPYDVLAIDYLSHLQHEGNDQVKGITEIFKMAQSFSRSYRDRRGLMVVTPLQTNKQGVKEAEDGDHLEENWGVYGLGAIDTYTQATRDMDFILSVWKKGPLEETGQVKISKLKSKGPTFKPFFARIDYRTWYYREISLSSVNWGSWAAKEPAKRGRTPHDWPPRGRYVPKPVKDTSLDRLKAEADLDDIRNRFDFEDDTASMQ